MGKINIDIKSCLGFYNHSDYGKAREEVVKANLQLHDKSGAGNEFLGWVDLPSSIKNDEIANIQGLVGKLKSKIDYLVVIGIGGSYLGARAVIEALNNSFSSFDQKGEYPKVLYAGHHISEDYLHEMIEFLAGKKFGMVVISKSGTTTEPALAFRLLKKELEKTVPADQLAELIVAVTDESRGALRSLADQEGYETFVIPDDVGGRFSVFTPVGLLPVAFAGFDIAALIEGARDMEKQTGTDVKFEDNLAMQYAAIRNVLYRNGKGIEILANYHPKLQYVTEWWKQLYGESEGKDKKGIFPAGVNFTTDLHSMGQYIQDGMRNLFETVISVMSSKYEVRVPTDEANLDKLNYIAGKRVDEVNKMAELGTKIAHVDGGVPNIKIELPALDEYHIGQLLYLFEKACGISGYLLRVNPFDQPGVEDYKRNMFALLGKPGFEAETEKIKKRI